MSKPEETIVKCSVPCAQCPWRTANQGKKSPWGFYTKANLKRLWSNIRRAYDGEAQSCHPTDTSHPDHVAAGAKGEKPMECAGSVIVVMREFAKLVDETNTVTPDSCNKYLAKTKGFGLTKKGIQYWLIARFQMGGVPFLGGAKLPLVNVDDPEISNPFVKEIT
jgi:hypothetical protein